MPPGRETWQTAEALAELRREADGGDALAQYRLAGICATGDGVAQDVPAALGWCSKAAEQGLAEAEYNLGLIHAQGLGVPDDQAEAASWFRRAADHGHPAAQFEMGVRYATGNGVPRDDREAACWYRQAAERGHAAAQFNLGVRHGQGRGVDASDSLAAWWYRQAADQGHAAAQFNLGIRHAHGDGVPQDLVEAYWWVHLAAARTSGAPQARYTDALEELAAADDAGPGGAAAPAHPAMVRDVRAPEPEVGPRRVQSFRRHDGTDVILTQSSGPTLGARADYSALSRGRGQAPELHRSFVRLVLLRGRAMRMSRWIGVLTFVALGCAACGGEAPQAPAGPSSSGGPSSVDAGRDDHGQRVGRRCPRSGGTLLTSR